MSASAISAIRPTISLWSAVSPYGIGRDAFIEGIGSQPDPAVQLDQDRWHAAEDHACLVPGFEIRDVLGKKGTRSMDRVSALAVTASGELLRNAPVEGDGRDIGLVLGTTTGSVQSMMDFTRTSMTAEHPFYVDPAVIPNIVLNCAASQCAIWHQLRGPNTTVAGGRGSTLLGLGYAARLLASGRASKVLCGAAEEFSGARSWLDRHTRGADAGDVVLGEGSAMLLIEPGDRRDRPPMAQILAVESMVYLDGDVTTTLRKCVDRALRNAKVKASEVWAALPSALPGLAGEQERALLSGMFDSSALTRVPDVGRLGDTSAATSAFQIVSLLAVAERTSGAAGNAAVVTTVDRDGTVACAVLRLLVHCPPKIGLSGALRGKAEK
ncbi:3-oxoacyl-[acyl-carrier-protein] synthase II [Saccharothrix ecbatanensis]|jgi:3-oxoacyl-[acyl-carrier-protein] synthase II|uniref:3-oxoacyl-[acyl-carrier-protein] synthase II n=1 Tax=Saccharothrix ecbatanensis TaxID=1105145 RepID=A0A7W9HJW6_9PSEU|nr:beta-ketoacyl synthase N-terminal-like domain-containing protein [Saccharothrix ecbatanensis]MBB5803642.1 3-oxoacyl-[acyl-carrier-protein] synthase II [Saccharothrix ecbatanensis]